MVIMDDLKQNQSSNEKPKGNKIINILIFIGMILLIQIPIGVSLIALPFSVKFSKLTSIALSMLITGTALLIIWLVRNYYLSHTYERQYQSMRGKDIFINIGFLVLSMVFSILSSVLMVIFTGNDTTANEKEINENLDLLLQKDHLPHISIVATVVLMICIIGPYLEELLFRGIFKETLFMKYRFWLPFIISSIIFSSQHLSTNIFSYAIYFLMGCVLYLAYNRRRNIKDSMMVHMLNNSVSTLPVFVGYLWLYFR